MANDLTSLAPASVSVVFPRKDDCALAQSSYVSTVTLVSLALSEYAGIQGHPPTKVIRDSAVARFTGGVVRNQAELDALARQIATDYYRWLLGPLRQWFGGVAPWNPEGLHDLEFSQSYEKLTTLLERSPLEDRVDILLHASNPYGSVNPADVFASPVAFNNASVSGLFTAYGNVSFPCGTTFTGNPITVCNDVTFGCPAMSGDGGTTTIIFENTTNVYNYGNTYNYGPTYYYTFVYIGDGVIYGNPVYFQAVTCVSILEAPVRVCTGAMSSSISDSSGVTILTTSFTVTATTALRLYLAMDWDAAGVGNVGDEYAATLTVLDASNVAQFTATDELAFYVGSANDRRLETTVPWLTNPLLAGTYTIKVTARQVSGAGIAYTEAKTCLFIDPLPIAQNQVATLALPNGTQVSDTTCYYTVNACCAMSISGSGSGSGPDCNIDCVDCPTAPSAWTVIANDFSPPYDVFNGTFTVVYNGECSWSVAVPPMLESGSGAGGIVTYLVGGIIRVQYLGLLLVTTFTPVIDGNPDPMSMVFTADMVSGDCAEATSLNWAQTYGSPPAFRPNAIELDPTSDPDCTTVPLPGCMTTCSACPLGVTDIWQIQFEAGMFTNSSPLVDWTIFNPPAAFPLVAGYLGNPCVYRWQDNQGDALTMRFVTDVATGAQYAFLEVTAGSSNNFIAYRAPLNCAGPMTFSYAPLTGAGKQITHGNHPTTWPGAALATAVGDCSGSGSGPGSGTGPLGTCSYTIKAVLFWPAAMGVCSQCTAETVVVDIAAPPSNDSCDDCADWLGLYTLQAAGVQDGLCYWSAQNPLCDQTYTIQASLTSNGTMVVKIIDENEDTQAQWTSFNFVTSCNNGTTIQLGGGATGNDCSNWPIKIALTFGAAGGQGAEANEDLELYGQVTDVLEPVCYYLNPYDAGGLTLAPPVAIHPDCAPEPMGPATITGTYTQSHEFRFWQSQTTNCASMQEGTGVITVTNDGTELIDVNGVLVQPGRTATINQIDYAGYDTGDDSDYSGNNVTKVKVTCISQTVSGSAPLLCATLTSCGTGSGSGASSLCGVVTANTNNPLDCVGTPEPSTLLATVTASNIAWLPIGYQFPLYYCAGGTAACETNGVVFNPVTNSAASPCANSIAEPFWGSPLIMGCDNQPIVGGNVQNGCIDPQTGMPVNCNGYGWFCLFCDNTLYNNWGLFYNIWPFAPDQSITAGNPVTWNGLSSTAGTMSLPATFVLPANSPGSYSSGNSGPCLISTDTVTIVVDNAIASGSGSGGCEGCIDLFEVNSTSYTGVFNGQSLDLTYDGTQWNLTVGELTVPADNPGQRLPITFTGFPGFTCGNVNVSFSTNNACCSGSGSDSGSGAGSGPCDQTICFIGLPGSDPLTYYGAISGTGNTEALTLVSANGTWYLGSTYFDGMAGPAADGNGSNLNGLTFTCVAGLLGPNCPPMTVVLSTDTSCCPIGSGLVGCCWTDGGKSENPVPNILNLEIPAPPGGITNVDCSECAEFADTYELDLGDSTLVNCEWTTTVSLCGKQFTIAISFQVPGFIMDVLIYENGTGNTIAAWTASSGDAAAWACASGASVTLNYNPLYVNDNSMCKNWPQTVTVSAP